MKDMTECNEGPRAHEHGRRRRLTTAGLFSGFLMWLVLAAGPGTAAGSGPVLLDRALEAAALRRDDVTIHMESRRPHRGSPIFEQWMTAPLEAPAEAQGLALHLLSLADRPHAWLAALPLLEGLDLPLEPPPPPPAGGFRLPADLSPAARAAVSGLLEAVSAAQEDLRAAFDGLTAGDIRLLERRLFPADLDPLQDKEAVYDPEALDETREALRAAGRVDREALVRAGVIMVRAAWEAARLLSRDDAFLARSEPVRFATALGEVRIGGAGPDVHEGPALLILDPGGDDIYLGRVASAGPGSCSLVIDLAGDDVYLGRDRTQGAGVRGAGLLLDMAGDDLYRGGSASQGAALFGVGLLVDVKGDDRYIGGRFTQAAAAWGWGGLLDLEGDDLFQCGSQGQAFTWLRGSACLVDLCGDDRYLAGTGRPDPREPDMNQSFAQGFAMGLRNLCPGGTAMLIDAAGNDVYQGQYFAQGASYWMGAGILYDHAGRDTYLARRYAQGAGIHLSFGMLLDREGDDHTVSWGVSQGCGHDFGVGVLVNDAGDDTYTADWLSMGASEANGIGIFADNRGSDGYETRAGAGFGGLTPSRRSGGLGLFLDADGRDRYSNRGSNDYTWFSNRWAVGVDAEAGGAGGLTLASPEGPKPCRPDKAGLEREQEASRLAETLAEAESLSPPRNVEALLAVAAHWGHERDIPEKAKKRLLAMDPEVSVPALVERLDTPGIMEWFVMTELFSTHARTALPFLRKEALEGEGTARVRALNVLGALRNTRALDACSKGLEDSDPAVRAAAAGAVGKLLERGRRDAQAHLEEVRDRAVSDLRPLLRDPAPSVRAASAYALGRMEEAALLDRLVNMLRDGNASVRDAAALSLVFFGDRAVAPLARVMDPADTGICIIGLDVLGRIDTPPARTAASGFLDHPDAVVRKAAEHALGVR